MANMKEDPRREFAKWITKKLVAEGHVAYFAGGCVRDQLLGISPSDYDVATDAGPRRIREIFGEARTLMIGEAFGVVCIVGRKELGEGRVEVATFRSDATYSDGRHPDYVTFTDARHDAERRDFTINGLFYDPLAEQVLDYVGGQTDLADGLLRCIGNATARFNEDKLRMLRAIRFAARFNLKLEEQTFEAIRRHAAEIEMVSAERVAMELRKMLVLPKRAWAAKQLWKTGLLPVILPSSLTFLWEHEQWHQTLERIDTLEPPHFESALAALLLVDTEQRSSVPKFFSKLDQEMVEHLRLSRDEIDATIYALKHARTLSRAKQLPWSVVQPLLVSRFVSIGLSLANALEREEGGVVGSVAWCREKLQLPDKQLNPPHLLTGDDLQALGLRPGPQFKEIISVMRQKQLDRELNDREMATAWLQQYLAR